LKTRATALQRIGDYFREIRLTTDLLMLPEERSWLARPPHNPQPTKLVLHLGCNVLRTPHMVQTVSGVFQKLRLGFVAVGGPTYCCGAPFLQDAPEEAQAVAQRSAEYMAEFQPERVVMWCPGCLSYFPRIAGRELPFKLQHVTEFLVEHLERLPLQRPVSRRVALHYHNGNPVALRQAAHARFLLKAVPELEVVDIPSDPRLGLQCTAASRRSLGAVWDSILAAQLDQAVDMGAEVLTPIHHSCHRMLVHFQEKYPIQIEHYLSLVGNSLGLEIEDSYRKYLLLADAVNILTAARPCLLANNVDVESARALVQKIFVERTPS